MGDSFLIDLIPALTHTLVLDVLLPEHRYFTEANMSQSSPRSTDLPLLPALYVGLLAFGAAIHHSPTLLSPMLNVVHALTLALVP